MKSIIKSKIGILKNSPLIKGALILSIGGLICKIIGIFYRVPLTNIVGSVGMGLYGLVFPIYSLLLVLSSSSIPMALSKIIAENINNKVYVHKLVKVAFSLLFIVGLVLTILLIGFSKFVANIQGAPIAWISFVAIAPSIFFVSLICVYRGVFQGYKDMSPTSKSQVIEQIVKLVLGLALAFLLLPFGVGYSVAGALFGVTISELFALLYLKFKYDDIKYDLLSSSVDDKKYKTFDIFKQLVKVITPITLSSVVIPIFLVVESLIVVNLLVHFGQDSVSSISQFGLYGGVVNTLINVPIMIMSAIAISVIPILSSTKDDLDFSKISIKCINLCAIVALPIMLLFTIFPNQIINILYPTLTEVENMLASKLLALSSSTIFSLGVFYVTTALLQAHNKYYFPIVNVLIFSLFRVAFFIFAIKDLGIYALSVSSTIFYLMMCVANILYLRQFIDLKNNNLFVIFLNSIVFILVCFICYAYLYPYLHTFALLLSGLISALIYLGLNVKLVDLSG